MNYKLALLTLTILLLAACSPVSTPTPQPPAAGTVVPAQLTAQPTEAPTAAALPTDNNEPTTLSSPTMMEESEISIHVPEGVAAGYSVITVEAQRDEQNPWFDKHPTYREIDLSGYALPDTFHKPHIDIYPIEEYARVNVYAAQTAADLKALLASQQAQSGQALPFLPAFNAAQVFTAKPEFLTFANGSGVRYLTQYQQSFYPVLNKQMFYTFQGLTSDGKYYIGAVLPVGAPFLQEDFDFNNPNAYPLPEGGIAFPSLDSNDLGAEVQAYTEKVIQKLDQTPGAQFSIPLSTLDAMMQSLDLQTQ